MQTLRQQLAALPPRVSLKAALRAYLRARRAQGRLTGDRGVYRDRSSLDAALDVRVDDSATPACGRLKDLFRQLLLAEEVAQGPLAVELDVLLCELVAPAATQPLSVTITGWPPGLSAADRAALMGSGSDLQRLDPRVAADLVAALDGRVIGGHRLQVRVDLPDGLRLPTRRRTQRNRARRGGPTAWLPHLDEIGRFSLSSRGLAARQALDFGSPSACPVVVDAFCGCGGNALALSQAGHRVIALELDAGRLALARRNAYALGLAVDFRQGDARLLVPRLADPEGCHGLFLDPPWGGPSADHSADHSPTDWSGLVPLETASLAGFRRLVLKAPASFAVQSLPSEWSWSWRIELSDAGVDGRCVVSCITALGVRKHGASLS